MTRPVVVKVGGSLLAWPLLGERLGSYLERRNTERLLVIVGGGPSADVVRDLDQTHGLGDALAHELALRALDLTAHLLAAIAPSLMVVDQAEALEHAWSIGRIPVLAPRQFLDDSDRSHPLERSWDVTTDSIAARVAELLGAGELVLLKSAPLPPGLDREQAAELGLVDRAFPNVSKTLEYVTYLNLRDPCGIAQALPRCLDAGAGRAGESPWSPTRADANP